MKKVMIIILLFSFFVAYRLKGYSETGHEDFIQVDFIDDGELLINMSKEEIDYGYKQIERAKFWGWRTYYFNYNKDASYIGEVLFSKSNRTATAYDVDYTIETSDVVKNSTTVTGSLSAKITGAIKKITGTLTGEVEGEKETQNTVTKTEETRVKIEIPPYGKITLRVTGEVKVTNAVSKYYILGMAFKKGTWETLEVVTQYYELYEEKYR